MEHSDRLAMLERAKMATLSGDYAAALLLIQAVLSQFSDDLEALRLKGNTLELRAFAFPDQSDADKNADIVAARECYERILCMDPNNTMALRDIADHFKSFENEGRAKGFYKKLISILEERRALGQDVESELMDAIREYAECSSRP